MWIFIWHAVSSTHEVLRNGSPHTCTGIPPVRLAKIRQLSSGVKTDCKFLRKSCERDTLSSETGEKEEKEHLGKEKSLRQNFSGGHKKSEDEGELAKTEETTRIFPYKYSNSPV